MIVHLGVILVAVALVTSSAYTESTELRLRVGEEVAWGGHTFELVDVVAERDDRTEVVRANVRLDGGQAYGPAITTFLQMGQPIGTPSVRTGLTHDVYLTIAGTNTPTVGGDEATIEVFKKPLILWMWIGGLLMAVGTVLAAFPGRRRRDPLGTGVGPRPGRGAFVVGRRRDHVGRGRRARHRGRRTGSTRGGRR